MLVKVGASISSILKGIPTVPALFLFLLSLCIGAVGVYARRRR